MSWGSLFFQGCVKRIKNLIYFIGKVNGCHIQEGYKSSMDGTVIKMWSYVEKIIIIIMIKFNISATYCSLHITYTSTCYVVFYN